MNLMRRTPTLMMALLCAAGACSMAMAQSIHRIVGPDGKVTFSDRAPDKGAADSVVSPGGPALSGAAAAGTASLPYELRQVASRFPVTLYTGPDCAPCTNARNLLVLRGVPFSERTVESNDDVSALQRLSGNTTLPLGTIGKQQLRGFSDAEWTQYLDLAGYPKESKLPASYRRPAATPLTPPKPTAPASAPAEATEKRDAPVRPRPTLPPPAPGTPTPANPAGIRF